MTQHNILPFVYALVNFKTEEIYVKMFNLLLNSVMMIIKKINDNPDLEIVTDF